MIIFSQKRFKYFSSTKIDKSITMNSRFLTLLLVFSSIVNFSLSAHNYRQVTVNQLETEGKIWGIDMSHHQCDVEWEKLSIQKPNFIFFKATEGATHVDTKYSQNYDNARKEGIIVGTYHFFSYKSTGKAQAEHFLSVAKYNPGDLPLVLDAENARYMPSQKIITKELMDFIKTVTEKTGKKPIVYCNNKYYKQYLEAELKNDHILWICDFQKEPDCDWHFWQATDQLKISGVRGTVDFNIFNGTIQKLTELLL